MSFFDEIKDSASTAISNNVGAFFDAQIKSATVKIAPEAPKGNQSAAQIEAKAKSPKVMIIGAAVAVVAIVGFMILKKRGK